MTAPKYPSGSTGSSGPQGDKDYDPGKPGIGNIDPTTGERIAPPSGQDPLNPKPEDREASETVGQVNPESKDAYRPMMDASGKPLKDQPEFDEYGRPNPDYKGGNEKSRTAGGERA